jgi:hypothetical protein
MDPDRLLWVPGAKTIFIPNAPEQVAIYDLTDMDALLTLNRLAFSATYTNPEDVIRDSKDSGLDPFFLYQRGWRRHELI